MIGRWGSLSPFAVDTSYGGIKWGDKSAFRLRSKSYAGHVILNRSEGSETASIHIYLISSIFDFEKGLSAVLKIIVINVY